MHQALNVTVVPSDAGMDFGLSIGSQIQYFRISLEALRDHFGANDATCAADLLACFHRNEQAICEKAFAHSPIPPNAERLVLESRLF